MNLTHKNFSFSQRCFRNPQREVETAPMWTYETAKSIYDVSISHYNAKGEKCEPHYVTRVNSGKWVSDVRDIFLEPIHRAIVQFYFTNLILAKEIISYHTDQYEAAQEKKEFAESAKKEEKKPIRSKKTERTLSAADKVMENMREMLVNTGMSEEEIAEAMEEAAKAMEEVKE